MEGFSPSFGDYSSRMAGRMGFRYFSMFRLSGGYLLTDGVGLLMLLLVCYTFGGGCDSTTSFSFTSASKGLRLSMLSLGAALIPCGSGLPKLWQTDSTNS